MPEGFLAAVWPDPPGDQTRIKPPKGYTVQKLQELGGEMLKPDGWFFQTQRAATTLVYRITKEDVTQGKGFITGFTINIVPSVSKSGQKPSEAASAYLEEYETNAKVIKRDDP